MLEQRKKEVNKKRCDIVDGSEIQLINQLRWPNISLFYRGFVHPRFGLGVSEPSTILGVERRSLAESIRVVFSAVRSTPASSKWESYNPEDSLCWNPDTYGAPWKVRKIIIPTAPNTLWEGVSVRKTHSQTTCRRDWSIRAYSKTIIFSSKLFIFGGVFWSIFTSELVEATLVLS